MIPLWLRHPIRWNWCVRRAEAEARLRADYPEIRLHISAGQYYTLKWPPSARKHARIVRRAKRKREQRNGK